MKSKINGKPSESVSEKPIGVITEYWIAYEKSPFAVTEMGKYAARIRVTATKHDINLRQTAWAIYGNVDYCLNKKTKKFEYEPLPSSRTSAYLRNHRFSTAQEAIAFFRKHFTDGYVFIEA
ncbi:MAG: hypothetical protein V1928_00770 [Parcubacteria group bacterium]